MKTVHEVSKLAGVSVRTLQYYDKIGLLVPASRSEAGYRLYDDDDLARLQQILFFRELEFPLAHIRRIMESPHFDANEALDQQIQLLELKKEHIEELIELAKKTRNGKVKTVSFNAFDTSKIDEYAKRAQEQWGDTPQWEESEAKRKNRSKEDEAALARKLLELFVPFGKMAAQGKDPECSNARKQVQALQGFISANYYQCTDEILAGLGKMYASGGEFTLNINNVAGPGAAEFAARAIKAYCAA